MKTKHLFNSNRGDAEIELSITNYCVQMDVTKMNAAGEPQAIMSPQAARIFAANLIAYADEIDRRTA